MMKQIATCLLVALLMTGVLVSGIPVFISYASVEETGNDEGSSGGEEQTPAEESEPEPEPETPPAEEEEPQPPAEDDTCQGGPPGIDGCPPAVEEPQPELPICDGSPQDCITNDGNICLEGQGGHECECSEDMSDCPMHPSLLQPDEDCLFHPELPKCASDNGVCPEGFFQNEDANCVPDHPNGCPEGFHSHEDDETGRCIPDSVPCEPGFTRDPDFPTCSSITSVCRDHPDEEVCNNDNDNDNNNHHKQQHDKVIKIIKNIDIVNKINNIDDDNDDIDIEQTIVAINYAEGAGINCVFDNDDNGQCETFDVTKDSGKEPLLQIIPFS